MKKNVFFYLVIVLPFVFSNCGSDDGDNNNGLSDKPLDAALLAPLLGNWTADFKTVSGCDQAGDYDCGDFLTCLFVQITDEGFYSFTDVDINDPANTDDNPGSVSTVNSSGQIKELTATTMLFCEPNIFGDTDFDCSDPITYSVSGSTLTATWTDSESPGCTFKAIFTKE